MSETSSPAVLEASGIGKRFGGVTALDGIDFSISAGEIVALVGDNGAGKSTLIKVLSGAMQPDDGQIRHHGAPVSLASPSAARALGIETVYQDLALIGPLDIASNMFLGRELRQKGFLSFLRMADEKRMAVEGQQHLESLGLTLPSIVRLPVESMSGGQRQAVAIARASASASDLLIMDEPTAALGVAQSNAVLRLIRRVAERGVAVILITHTMPHVLAIADRVVVLRRGSKVADLPREGLTADQLVSLIVGFDPDSAEAKDLVI